MARLLGRVNTVIIRVDKGEPTIEDHDLFSEFHVLAPQGASTEDLAALLGERTGVAGSEHLWIAAAAIRCWVGDRADESWEAGFDAMLDYARSKDWTNDRGSHIRAHVERGCSDPRVSHRNCIGACRWPNSPSSTIHIETPPRQPWRSLRRWA